MINLPGDGYHIIVFSTPDDLDADDYNVDIEVVFDSDERYMATLFTVENLKTLMNRHKHSGECNSGTYFWAVDMVIVEQLTLESIQELVRYLIANDELSYTFAQIVEDD